MKVISFFGTRPEAIKMVPLVKELEKNKNIESIVVSSGQHKELLDEVLELYSITPKYNLHVMENCKTLNQITSRILFEFEKVLDIEKPDLVLVHGDTTTAMAGALACFNKKIKIGHVEAGLRSFNLESPYPEEMNRVFIDTVADFYFAPTNLAKENLLNQKVDENKIFVVGNTIIDLVKFNLASENIINTEDIKEKHIVLLTTHRRENLGKNMENIFSAVNIILEKYKDVCVIFPMHPNPKIKEIADKFLKPNKRLKIIKPLNSIEFNQFEKQASVILTDSGGVQEECVYIGKPTLVLRTETERPEGLSSNCLFMAGVETENIVNIFNEIAKNDFEKLNTFKSSNVFGDGKTSERIVDIILNN